MFEDTSPFDSSDVTGFAKRIHGLGNATDQFFTRIYDALTGNTRRREQDVARKLQNERQQLLAVAERREQELEQLNGVIAAIPEGIVLQDLDGRVVLINDGARKLVGGQRAFRDSDLSQLFDSYRDIVQVDSELAPLGEPTRLEINNRIIGATLAAVANSDGKRIGTLIVLRDITDQALGDRLKDQFATAVSHELRTPMNAIKMASEVLLGSDPEAAPNRRMLEMVGRNVDILDRMIVELLDISEITAGTFEVRREPINAEQLIWSVVTGMVPQIKASKLDVSVMARDLEHLNFVGDPQRLRWALGHLLQNSIHYTVEGSIILTVSLSDEERLAIQVIDTGVGISEKDLPHIFERFYRGEPRTPDGKLLDPRGLGQGLFIARTVAEAHQGHVGVRSQPGQGSVFTMVLPSGLATLPA